MTLEQHIAENKAKNARRWTYAAASFFREGESYLWRGRIDSKRVFGPMFTLEAFKEACKIIYLHSRKPSTRAEAKQLLAILERRA